MTKLELTEYLEANLSAYTIFIENAFAYQEAKNKRRPNKKRWTEEKMMRATNKMWLDFVGNVFEKLKLEVRKDTSVASWEDFIAKYEMLDSLDEAIISIEFE